MSDESITLKINNRTFLCKPLSLGDPKVYNARSLDATNGGLYYVANSDDDYAYSRTVDKAIKNLASLKKIKKFESGPINFEEKMSLDTFVFYYRAQAFACTDVKANLLKDIDARNIKRQPEYTFQQWLCFAMPRHNFEYFKLYIMGLVGKDHIHAYYDCEKCKERFNIKCQTELLKGSK